MNFFGILKNAPSALLALGISAVPAAAQTQAQSQIGTLSDGKAFEIQPSGDITTCSPAFGGVYQDRDGLITTWSLVAGNVTMVTETHKGEPLPTTRLALQPDGKVFVATSADGKTLRLLSDPQDSTKTWDITNTPVGQQIDSVIPAFQRRCDQWIKPLADLFKGSDPSPPPYYQPPQFPGYPQLPGHERPGAHISRDEQVTCYLPDRSRMRLTQQACFQRHGAFYPQIRPGER